ncbi:2-amino-4-hydroxy-6-hydroxymethyldihydropteridine diphosphokinase [Algibacter miyuki]|uniref:2-amino-4-hydroxy-6-hydroxymethyldihydropteridine pyrophosphokinase n=1 Tax=Algibacter miyuki TaxID=1306933 RepID=A0ABV5H2D9_9FLAO|nr:2-amino-4-hydroxy-6-hydroxymethyldihydropteridine diphosphokinase [Algibacter miyuki]MDN3664467.1 2-amino-4-hydroxy-6-hydroxymethyldihydropteridine diphosphokinase [Algibacter miyuki]
MTKPTTFHIALGSNKGDKLENLQHAIEAIHLEVGNIKAISKVYQSPAFGFESDDFYNACLVLESYLRPQVILEILQEIETQLGRKPKQTEVYEAREIDLDIIFSEQEIISTETLMVPHPEMQKRKFVLLPLHDVAAKMTHPKFNKSVSALLTECADDSVLSPLEDTLKNPLERLDFSKYNYIAIEGNIGAGKTSLTKMIAQDFNAKSILERFTENPFLPKFYEDPKRYAFTVEMAYLTDRYQQITEDFAQLDLFKDFIVSDYDVYKSLIFSKITLKGDEFSLYRKLFYMMYKDLRQPDLYIYLYQNTERLQQNIKKRGRDYEQNIEDDYLEKINSGYLEFLKTQPNFNVKIIDISDKDFVENRTDYLWVLGEICK